MVLDDVGWSLTLFKLFIHHRPTFLFVWSKKKRHNFVPGTEIQHCWMVLDSFELSSIQHWSITVQHHLTMLDNFWPTCLIRLNEPLRLKHWCWSMLGCIGCWSVQTNPTLSKMFDCAVQTGRTCGVQQCLIMFEQHVWSVWTGLQFSSVSEVSGTTSMKMLKEGPRSLKSLRKSYF